MPASDLTSDNPSTGRKVLPMLNQERMQNLYSNLPTSLSVSLIIAIILSSSNWNTIGHAEVISWNLALGATLLARLIAWFFWKFAKHTYSAESWLMIFRVGALATAMVWGLASYLLFIQGSATHQALLAFSIAGVASGSITSLTLDRVSAIGFVLLSVFPFSIRLYLEAGPVAMPFFSMSILFIFFVITTTQRATRMMEDRIIKNIESSQLADELTKKREVDLLIATAQETFIHNKNGLAGLKTILDEVIKFSGSQIGFIGRVEQDSNDAPYLKSLVFSGKDEMEQKIKRYQLENMPENGEFRNMNTLFGAAIISGKVTISNNIARDMRSTGVPDGHPPLHNFLAIPIYSEKKLCAIIGLANKKTNYDDDDAKKLAPIANTIAQFTEIIAQEEDHARDKAALVESSINTKIILDNVADGIIMIDNHGSILSFNKAAEIIFGYRKDQIIGKNISNLMPEPYKSMHNHYLNNYLLTRKANIIGKGREVLGLRKSGKTFPMDLIVSIIVNDNQPLFIGVIRDISEKNKAFVDQFKNSTKMMNLLGRVHNQIKNIHLSDTNQSTTSMDNLAFNVGERIELIDKEICNFINQFFFFEKNIKNSKLNLERTINNIIHTTEKNKQLKNGHIYFSSHKEDVYIDCDETLISLALETIITNLYNETNNHIHIGISEDRTKAKVTIASNINAAINPIGIQERIASITGTVELGSNNKNVIDLLGLVYGTSEITVEKSRIIIYIDFPLTIKRP